MSTAFRLIPMPHATKRTTSVQLLNDGHFRTRVEDPLGTVTDKEWNFSSLVEGESYEVVNEPFMTIEAQKIEGVARYIIWIEEYYDAAATKDNIPEDRFLWYDYKTEKANIPDLAAIQTATPANPLTILWKSQGTPIAPTVAINPTVQTLERLYQQLGTVEARRQYIKNLIRANLEHPDLALLLSPANYYYNVAASHSTLQVTPTHIMMTAQAAIWFLEMLAMAISIDSNLQSEPKFNLLAGDAGLDIGTIRNGLTSDNLHRFMGAPASIVNRSSWNYVRLGSITSASPWAYTAPTGRFSIQWQNLHSITLTGANTGTSWRDWIRS